jgi:hypothetical protein
VKRRDCVKISLPNHFLILGGRLKAYFDRVQNPDGNWNGSSRSVDFLFHEPSGKVSLWRGYPVY